MKHRILFSFFLFGLCGLSLGQIKINPILVDSSFDSVSNAKLQQAVFIMDSVFNTKSFAQEVLSSTFDVGNEGLSSQDILALLFSGKDHFKDTLYDGCIDLRLKVFDSYYGSLNFGITDMSTHITRTHRCFILQNNVKCYVSHLAHEYMHQIGFYDWHSTWIGPKTQSVPYKIGNIVDKLIGNTGPCLAKKEECKK